MAYSDQEINRANQRAAQHLIGTPHVVAARFDHPPGRIVVDLSNGLSISFKPQMVEGLEQAGPHQLTQIEISPSGFGLHFPAVDADVYVPGLLEGVFGSRSWMASQLDSQSK